MVTRMVFTDGSWSTCGSLIPMGVQIPLEQPRPARAAFKDGSTVAFCKIDPEFHFGNEPFVYTEGHHKKQWMWVTVASLVEMFSRCHLLQGEMLLTAYSRVRKSWTSPWKLAWLCKQCNFLVWSGFKEAQSQIHLLWRWNVLQVSSSKDLLST